jgi:oligopeptide transport system substrate-binding protein
MIVSRSPGWRAARAVPRLLLFFGRLEPERAGGPDPLQRRRAAKPRSRHHHRPARGAHCQALFEGLTTRNAKGDIIPGMAESWTSARRTGSPTRSRFAQRIKWSNGDPLTASIFSTRGSGRSIPPPASEYSYQLYYLVNGEAYGTGKLTDFSQVGVKAPDDRTLVVTLTHPTAYFLELTSFQTLCPVHLPTVKKYGNDWTKPGRMVSNGPYVLKEWRLNDYILRRGESLLLASRADPSDQGAADEQRHRLLQSFLLAQDRSDSRYAQHSAGRWCRTSGTSLTFMPIRSARLRSSASTSSASRSTTCGCARRWPWRSTSRTSSRRSPARASRWPTRWCRRATPVTRRRRAWSYNPDEARRLLAEAGYPNGQGFPT